MIARPKIAPPITPRSALARRILPHLMASLLLATPALAAEPAVHATPQPKPLRKLSRTARAVPSRLPSRKPALNEIAESLPDESSAQLRPAVAPYLADGQARLRDAAFWRPDGAWRPANLGGWAQTGLASWYGGPRWQGHRTASGTSYNEHELTAAHATLPLGSRVLVTVPATGRSVIVTINDRPGTRSRIIDLSREAAAELGILREGVARVELSRL
jgi:rare lipoprotein A (peptidoglycan hydrolase)